MKHLVKNFTFFGQPLNSNNQCSFVELPSTDTLDFYTVFDKQELAPRIDMLGESFTVLPNEDGEQCFDWRGSKYSLHAKAILDLEICLDTDAEISAAHRNLINKASMYRHKPPEEAIAWKAAFLCEKAYSSELKDVLFNSEPIPLVIKRQGVPRLRGSEFEMAVMCYEEQQKLVKWLYSNPTVYFGGPIKSFLPLKTGFHRLHALNWQVEHTNYLNNEAAKVGDPSFRAVKTKLGDANKEITQRIYNEQLDHQQKLLSTERILINMPFRDGTKQAGYTKTIEFDINFDEFNKVSRITLKSARQRYSRAELASLLEGDISKSKLEKELRGMIDVNWRSLPTVGGQETAYVKNVVAEALLNALY